MPNRLCIEFKEVALQEAVATYLDGLEKLGLLAWNHPPNEGKRPLQTLLKLIRCGLKSGEPDCQIFPKNAAIRTFFIEIKTLTGTISQKQRERHSLYGKLGYHVYVVFAETPAEAVRKVERILKDEGVLK